MTTTILSQTSTQLKTMEFLFPGDKAHGLVFYDWTERGRTRFSLDCGELCAVLRALPTDLLAAVLVERGVLCTMGGEAPDVARELDALVAERQEMRKGCCSHCGQPETSHDPVAGGALCRREHGGNGEIFTTASAPTTPAANNQFSFIGKPASRTSTAANSCQEEA